MKKYILRYPENIISKPILSEAIVKTGVMVNIIIASVEHSKAVIIISVVGGKSEEEKIVSFLRKKGVSVESIEANIIKDEWKCIDCGACYGICPTKAITLDSEKAMVLDNNECIRCGSCITACPTRALKMQEA
ncbi:MAG: 4Fe-4S binding protein [Candidatus Altiarchaeota archaeon]|nr:4Fe-4S binding protein [Candidatus Altiarchaeota archaeon]